jgi:asparagine synthase (glutamine-hydrolysing)
MCGIAGIARQDGAPVDPMRLRRMTDALTHRGPDSSGEYLGDGIGLGVRRLRIIDLVTGDQPIANEDETVWTVFNGEIYNFQALRDRLVSRGHRFRTTSDTEVVVHAYEEFGDAFVSELRGMFALAVWDSRRRRLLLARDRLGKKPLLYSERDGELVFASEMQALATDPEPVREVDLGALGDYLSYGYVPGPATIFRGVRKLPPAHVLTWEQGTTSLKRYWDLRYTPKLEVSEAEALAELERRLDEAVRLRLIADVPLGALLSGGVDSSVVVALMARHSNAVRTFSIGFEDKAYDELAHAKRVAQRYETDHLEYVVREDAAAVLPTLVRHYGEPYADSSAIPTFHVSRIARGHVTVALNGDGGDEAFAGYDRFRAMRLAAGLRPFEMGGLTHAVSRTATKLLPAGRMRTRAARFLDGAFLPEPARYAYWISAISPETVQALVMPELARAFAAARSYKVERILESNAALGPVDRLLATDVETYLVDDLLAKMDIASMANSLETRSPLLDQEVVEFAALLPEELKVGPRFEQKYLLKKLARTLIPIENIERPKMGFAVPVGKWLRADLKEMAHDALFSDRSRARGYFREDPLRRLWDEHQKGSADHARPIWTLLMLELWHREFT